MVVAEISVMLLLRKLRQFIQEAISLSGANNEVERLEAEFTQMQCFLKDAEAKQEGDVRVKNWVRSVRDAAYDAEDAIDAYTFRIEILRRRLSGGCITRCVFFCASLIVLYDVGRDIKWINNKICMISERMWTYGIQNIVQGGSSSRSLQDWRFTSPLSQEPDFVGFEEDLEILLARLTEGDRRCVVSLVGMGGLGKTTLTKKVYNNNLVKTHFDSCAWISISQEYDVRDLLENIINCYMVLSEEELKKMNVFQLKHKISEYLEEKRYLIVLDDIWTNEAWDDLKDAFPDMKNGSRVMLTTRNKDVALHADATSQPHELQFLNNEESWKLFCTKAFPGQDGGCPRGLAMLGREIAEKCRGLPLAIRVIGQLLSRKEPWEWENAHKCISWQYLEGQPEISKVLYLSYKDLPYYLKPCFLYLVNFPDDYEFSAEQLIRIWVAEGLLQQRGEETLEEVGEDCLKELIQRSMVQVVRRSSSGGVKTCRIHNLLRDLCISEAKEGKFLEVHHENIGDAPPSRARRLAIHHNDLGEYISLRGSSPHLRSVLIYTQGNAWLQSEQEMFLFGGLKLLRVLSIHGACIKDLPWEIGRLIHLRYLGCTETELESLPLSIGNLPYLQTLFVTSCYNIDIPSTIMEMKQIRHIHMNEVGKSIYLGRWGRRRVITEGHPKLHRTSNLQTLPCVEAGVWMEGCLRKLTNLRKLGIVLDGEGAYDEVFYESIVEMDCLQSLSVVRRERLPLLVPFTRLHKLRKLHLEGTLERLPESHQFPTNLTKLTLASSFLEQDPLTMLEKLENLRVLRLLWASYSGKEMACTAQGFPQLEFLHLDKLDELEEWRVEEGAMPSLLHLQISGCSRLKMLPGLQHVTTLKKLELKGIHPLLNARLQENEGLDWHKIRNIPSISISIWEGFSASESYTGEAAWDVRGSSTDSSMDVENGHE